MLRNKYGHLIELVVTSALVTSFESLSYDPTYTFTLFIEKPALRKIAHVKGPPSIYDDNDIYLNQGVKNKRRSHGRKSRDISIVKSIVYNAFDPPMYVCLFAALAYVCRM